METQRLTRYPLHGRAQVALPSQKVLSGRTMDISTGGICIVLDDQIPLGIPCPIRFEMYVKGKLNIITALTKSVYGVFASQGGFRVGFEFKEDDPQRTALIKSLAGKKSMVDAPGSAPEPSASVDLGAGLELPG